MNLGIHHLLAAGRSCKRISEVEKENLGQRLGDFWDEIFQNALAVATLSVASVECFANELYFEGSSISPALNAAATSEISELVDKETMLRKFSVALAIRNGKRFDYGIVPIQNVDALIKLRNGVVHFRPEWFGEQEKHDKLSRVLMHKFKGSPFLPEEPLFPRAWASRDFAEWALKSTVTFLEYFYNEAALECPISQFKGRLESLSAIVL
jgi:hypothetical protein